MPVQMKSEYHVPSVAKYPLPKGGRFCENIFLKHLNGKKTIIEGRLLFF